MYKDSRPIIGIVGKPENMNERFHYIKINDEIKRKIIENKALPIGILPLDNKYQLEGENNKYKLDSEDIKNITKIIKKMDGIVLQGGIVSNTYEEVIVRICIKYNKPILGICSGFNNMIRALGGNLSLEEKDIHNKYELEYAHEVILEKSSELYKVLKKDKILVNSIHRYVANEKNIQGFKIAAICPIDNTVEAIEIPNHKFAIGIKWHPEFMPEMNNLFKKFVESCLEK